MAGTPQYIIDLYDNAEQALEHLLPYGTYESGEYFSDAVRVDCSDYSWKDHYTGQTGNLFQLWQDVRNITPEETAKEIQHWLRNQDLPDCMERFSFTADQMNDPDFLLGDYMEIFPKVNLYAGTTTLLGGYNGSGKSTLALQICNMATLYGIKSLVISPEMPPPVTAKILQRQSTSVGAPSPQEWQRTARHTSEFFMVSTSEDRLTPRQAISQMDAGYKQGARLIVLDSLTCVRTGHELHEQADFSDMLRNWSRSHTDCYLLVVAHLRKPSNHGFQKMSRYDIRGAGEISDLAGHVWLMKRKDPFCQRSVAEFGDSDAMLVVDKNRATGQLCAKYLRFANIQKLFHVGHQVPCYIDFDYEAENVVRLQQRTEHEPSSV